MLVDLLAHLGDFGELGLLVWLIGWVLRLKDDLQQP
jgi:hypothetical protein